jgi:hypothetical protein
MFFLIVFLKVICDALLFSYPLLSANRYGHFINSNLSVFWLAFPIEIQITNLII